MMIYLDNHATTRCDPRVTEYMMPYFSSIFGNPASDHSFGLLAEEGITEASRQISRLINSEPDELIYTSGATESNNIAILGACQSKKSERRKIVTTRIEHKSVLAPLDELQRNGWEIDYLPIDEYGQVKIEEAKSHIDINTFLVSVQLANSEIGTIQPITELANIAQNVGAVMHCDASQAIGKIPVNVGSLGVDFLSISGHKVYGPKGIGALWIRNGFEKVIKPIMWGGGHFGNIRPGTPPVPLIAGLGKACQLIYEGLEEETVKTATLRDSFEAGLAGTIKNLVINGSLRNRLPNNSSLTFPNVDAELLLANVPDVVASTGSACESGSPEPSRILLHLGISREAAYNTIRFGFGRFNSVEEIQTAIEVIKDAYSRIINTIS
jgi:cysteine desulfurase